MQSKDDLRENSLRDARKKEASPLLDDRPNGRVTQRHHAADQRQFAPSSWSIVFVTTLFILLFI